MSNSTVINMAEQFIKARRAAKSTLTREINNLKKLVAEKDTVEVTLALNRIKLTFRDFSERHEEYHSGLEDEDEIDTSDTNFFDQQDIYIEVLDYANHWLRTGLRRIENDGLSHKESMFQDDKKLIKLCDEKVLFKDSHYELPILLKENVNLPNNIQEPASQNVVTHFITTNSLEDKVVSLGRVENDGLSHKEPMSRDDNDECDEAGDIVRNTSCVDDCLKSVRSKEEAVTVIEGAKDMMLSKSVCRQTKFVAIDSVLLEQVAVEDSAKELKDLQTDMSSISLGVKWNVKNDEFYVGVGD